MMTSELHTYTGELKSTERRPHIIEDAGSLMLDQVKSQGTQIRELQAVRIEADVVRAPLESNFR